LKTKKKCRLHLKKVADFGKETKRLLDLIEDAVVPDTFGLEEGDCIARAIQVESKDFKFDKDMRTPHHQKATVRLNPTLATYSVQTVTITKVPHTVSCKTFSGAFGGLLKKLYKDIDNVETRVQGNNTVIEMPSYLMRQSNIEVELATVSNLLQPYVSSPFKTPKEMMQAMQRSLAQDTSVNIPHNWNLAYTNVHLGSAVLAMIYYQHHVNNTPTQIFQAADPDFGSSEPSVTDTLLKKFSTAVPALLKKVPGLGAVLGLLSEESQ
jgi:hypothetical protein